MYLSDVKSKFKLGDLLVYTASSMCFDVLLAVNNSIIMNNKQNLFLEENLRSIFVTRQRNIYKSVWKREHGLLKSHVTHSGYECD